MFFQKRPVDDSPVIKVDFVLNGLHIPAVANPLEKKFFRLKKLRMQDLQDLQEFLENSGMNVGGLGP
jgi:hypothetical protein